MKKFWCARGLGWALPVAALFTSFMSHESRADESHAEDDVVITGTRTPEQVQRALVKTDVVSAREAERRGATNVAEALATQPGVRVDPGAYGFLGNPSAIQIQGFDLQRVLILEDGEPVVGQSVVVVEDPPEHQRHGDGGHRPRQHADGAREGTAGNDRASSAEAGRRRERKPPRSVSLVAWPINVQFGTPCKQ